MDEHNWLELAKSIQKGRTVLVLGPDALPFYRVRGERAADQPLADLPADPSFSQISRRRIREKLNGQIMHFYRRDNLFLFASPRAKRDAIDCLEETITEAEWLPDSEQVIADAPFRRASACFNPFLSGHYLLTKP